MAEIHFYLKSEAKESKLIYLQFNYYSTNRLKISTKISIPEDQWDAKRELPRKSYKHYHLIKGRIELYRELTERLYLEYISKGQIPTTDQLKADVLSNIDNGGSQAPDVIRFIQTFIAKRSQSNAYTKGTIQTYRPIIKDLMDFAPGIRFDKFNAAWMMRFRDHLYAKGLEQNTVHKKLSTLRNMIGEAIEDGIQVNQDFRSKRIKAPKVETTQIYLSEDEIERFYRAPVTGEREEARDVFVLMCYTGPRISDTWKIGRSSFFNQNGLEYFSFHMKKTKQAVNIPVHPFVREILDKYDWALPARSRQRLSDHIKEIGRIAKITDEIDLVKYPGGIMTITKVPKYTQIKTHTGRRSLACNMLLAGVPEQIVMAVGGWKSQKSFQPYVRLTASDKLKIASRSQFFTGARVIGMTG